MFTLCANVKLVSKITKPRCVRIIRFDYIFYNMMCKPLDMILYLTIWCDRRSTRDVMPLLHQFRNVDHVLLSQSVTPASPNVPRPTSEMCFAVSVLSVELGFSFICWITKGWFTFRETNVSWFYVGLVGMAVSAVFGFLHLWNYEILGVYS